jgi:chromosomal replication initiator protein
MHAIAWHIATKHPKRRVLYLSAEKFMYQFIKALRFKDTMSFKENFRSVDVLMIDDVQFISGKDSTQEEFFHTFNALVDQNRQVIISADKSPSDLEGMEDRLKSRLGWGLVADIHPATFELRLGILQAKVEKLGAVVPQNVLEFLATKINSNVRELEGALNRIAAHAQFVGEPLTLESTQRLLKDLLRANDKKLTIEDIQTKVAEHFNVRVSDMHSARRARGGASRFARSSTRQQHQLHFSGLPERQSAVFTRRAGHLGFDRFRVSGRCRPTVTRLAGNGFEPGGCAQRVAHHPRAHHHGCRPRRARRRATGSLRARVTRGSYVRRPTDQLVRAGPSTANDKKCRAG